MLSFSLSTCKIKSITWMSNTIQIKMKKFRLKIQRMSFNNNINLLLKMRKLDTIKSITKETIKKCLIPTIINFYILLSNKLFNLNKNTLLLLINKETQFILNKIMNNPRITMSKDSDLNIIKNSGIKSLLHTLFSSSYWLLSPYSLLESV